MLNRKALSDAFTKTLEKLRDTKYITCDANGTIQITDK